jgi:hypothetical protein
MDLNLDNYSIDEVKDIFNISDKNINISNGQKVLIEKLENIKKINQEDLPESKETLMEFYTKAMFKLLNMPINNEVKIDSSIFNNFEKEDNYVHDINDKQSKQFINSKDKLLPPLDSTPTVQNNDNFISRHLDNTPVSIFKTPIKYGDINPFTRNTLKQILNVNTKFRNNYTITPSTNFTIELPSTIKKVVSMKIIDTQFPETVYTVSDKLGSNVFFLYDLSGSSPSSPPGINYTVDISNGSYNTDTIVTAINDRLESLGNTWIKLEFNPDDGLMTFYSLGGTHFDLDFSYKKVVEFYNLRKTENNKHLFCPQLPSNIFKDQLTLGWLLGFRGDYIKPIYANLYKCTFLVSEELDKIKFSYTGKATYTGESLFDSHGAKYFLIAVNDYQHNHNTCFISPFQFQTEADNNIMAKIPTSCCYNCCENNPERIYFGPTDLNRLDIKIYDDFGRIVDINNADYSFTLKIEVLYDL